MAGPFGGHPTLERYLNWLREQGFQYRTGYADLEERSVLLIMVQNSDGEDEGRVCSKGSNASSSMKAQEKEDTEDQEST